MNIIDFHTHRLDATDALISVDPRQFAPQSGKWYSVGYHPWHRVDQLADSDFDLLEQCARHEQVLAIGETGMDTLRGGDLEVQAQVYVRHLQVAAAVKKTVVVHSVRTAQQIIALRHNAGLDSVALVIHGMRGNGHVAGMLIDAGCYLSYGLRHNPAAVLATPLDRLLIETDDSPADINDVACQVADTLALTAAEVKSLALANARRLLEPST